MNREQQEQKLTDDIRSKLSFHLSTDLKDKWEGNFKKYLSELMEEELIELKTKLDTTVWFLGMLKTYSR